MRRSEEVLSYREGIGGGRWHSASAQPELLERFSALRDATSSEIVRFAKKWGVLGLCKEHGLPRTHALGEFTNVGRNQLCPRVPQGRRGPRAIGKSTDIYVERFDHWQSLAARAGAVLEAAKLLYASKVVPRDLWRPIASNSSETPPCTTAELQDRWVRKRGLSEKELSVELLSRQREDLGLAVDEWLLMSDVRPRFWWLENERPLVDFQPGPAGSQMGGLFAALALQLAYRVSRAGRVIECVECGKIEEPTRAPRPGERTFCRDCRAAGVPQRYADEARRERNRRKQGSGTATTTRPGRSRRRSQSA
jgi:hypothetical protein